MTGPRPFPTQALSISDDDLCSLCKHCDYQPGDSSTCKLGWPGEFNEDHYVVECQKFNRKETS